MRRDERERERDKNSRTGLSCQPGFSPRDFEHERNFTKKGMGNSKSARKIERGEEISTLFLRILSYHMYMYTMMCIYIIHTYVCMYVSMYVYVYEYVGVCVYVYSCVYVYVNVYVRVRIHV